jgi:hypothetical protein
LYLLGFPRAEVLADAATTVPPVSSDDERNGSVGGGANNSFEDADDEQAIVTVAGKVCFSLWWGLVLWLNVGLCNLCVESTWCYLNDDGRY